MALLIRFEGQDKICCSEPHPLIFLNWLRFALSLLFINSKKISTKETCVNNATHGCMDREWKIEHAVGWLHLPRKGWNLRSVYTMTAHRSIYRPSQKIFTNYTYEKDSRRSRLRMQFPMLGRGSTAKAMRSSFAIEWPKLNVSLKIFWARLYLKSAWCLVYNLWNKFWC